MTAEDAREANADPATAVIVSRYHRPQHRLLSKHRRLYLAVNDAIGDGSLAAGDRIPPELDLARRVGVSLGTAQRALGRLAADGLIERRQGLGSFVADRRIAEEELWQFRFLAARGDAHYLPVVVKVHDVRTETRDGPWSQALGTDPEGFVLIERLVEVGGRFSLASRLWLPAGRFGEILRSGLRDVNLTNIKLLLRRRFGASTAAVEQVLGFATIGADAAGRLEVPAGTPAVRLDVTGFDQNGAAITYHEILIPENDCLLDLSYAGTPVKASHP